MCVTHGDAPECSVQRGCSERFGQEVALSSGQEVNGFCLAKFHIGLDDLPDLCTRDAFDSGMSAQDFFENDVMDLAREEFGSLVDDLD